MVLLLLEGLSSISLKVCQKVTNVLLETANSSLVWAAWHLHQPRHHFLSVCQSGQCLWELPNTPEIRQMSPSPKCPMSGGSEGQGWLSSLLVHSCLLDMWHFMFHSEENLCGLDCLVSNCDGTSRRIHRNKVYSDDVLILLVKDKIRASICQVSTWDMSHPLAFCSQKSLATDPKFDA